MMNSTSGGSNQVTLLIVNTVSRILSLQSRSLDKEFRTIILKRGLERDTILKRDVNVHNIITGLLSSPYHDKQEVLKLQHFMYKNIMTVEIKNNEREFATLNHFAAKQRRILKTITTDAVFKKCCDFLQYQKVTYSRYCGRRNESLWRTAIEDKDEQTASIDKWLQMVTNVFDEQQLDNVYINGKIALMNDLKIAKNETISIDPIMNRSEREVDSLVDDTEFVEGLDEDIESALKKNEPSVEEVNVDAFLKTLRDEARERTDATDNFLRYEESLNDGQNVNGTSSMNLKTNVDEFSSSGTFLLNDSTGLFDIHCSMNLEAKEKATVDGLSSSSASVLNELTGLFENGELDAESLLKDKIVFEPSLNVENNLVPASLEGHELKTESINKRDFERPLTDERNLKLSVNHKRDEGVNGSVIKRRIGNGKEDFHPYGSRRPPRIDNAEFNSYSHRRDDNKFDHYESRNDSGKENRVRNYYRRGNYRKNYYERNAQRNARPDDRYGDF